MRSMNRAWRGQDKVTDVLSFPLREGVGDHIQSNMLGDIVISVPEARRQARAARRELQREIEQLLVHGLVHLLGYDHERGVKEARSMERKEQQLLKKLS